MTAVHAHLGHLSRIQTEMDEGKGPQASATLKGPPCGGGHRPIRRRRRLICASVFRPEFMISNVALRVPGVERIMVVQVAPVANFPFFLSF